MHSVAEVFGIIGAAVAAVGLEAVRVEEAGGRVLGEGVRMVGDMPPFDRALLDGFAVRSGDAAEGAVLRMVGRQDAGAAVFGGVVGVGECVGINTGGVFPKGADGVLMVEHSEMVGLEGVRVLRGVGAGYGVQRRGADAREGAEVLGVGARLGAAQLAAAVAAGVGVVKVRRKVRAAVLTTGDELVGAGGAIVGGQIRNSNHPMLLRLVREVLGECGEVMDLGTCGDVEREIERRMRAGVEGAEVVVVSGGMSMGTKDHVPGVMRRLGAEFLVEKVKMKPGKPFVFGVVGDDRVTGGQGDKVREEAGGAVGRKYVCGLPGNPVSALVTFELFVREVLGRLMGVGGLRWERAVAGAEFLGNGDREFFQPVLVERGEGGLVVRPLVWRGSGDIFTLARAEGLVRRAVDAGVVRVGEGVEVLEL